MLKYFLFETDKQEKTRQQTILFLLPQKVSSAYSVTKKKMFQKSAKLSTDGLVLVLVVVFIVASVCYVFRLGLMDLCRKRKTNTQVYGVVEPMASSSSLHELEIHLEDGGAVAADWSTETNVEVASNHGPPRILLLGDSILDNQLYVSSGTSVAELLQKKVKENSCQVELFAKDGSTIGEVLLQLNQVPIEYNTQNTVLVLSVGGNDFLSGAEYDAAEVAYLHLIERMRKVFDATKIYLVNLYKPVDPMFVIYYRIIEKWNAFLLRVVEEGGLADGVVDVSDVITGPKDLVHKIEPSAVGGEKIASAIVRGCGSLGWEG